MIQEITKERAISTKALAKETYPIYQNSEDLGYYFSKKAFLRF